MTAETALTGRALDRALAEAMGGTESLDYRGNPTWLMMAKGKRRWMPLPHFSTSVDALIAGPEARLRANGWVQEGNIERGEFWVGWWDGKPFPSGHRVMAETASTEAEARARACLAALAALALREKRS